jgi:Kdo2-lipid IVA lauroyltransferase/acyltransferase
VNIQQFVTTEFGTKLWMALGRWLPTSAGHAFARTVTGVLSRRRDTSLYRTMRANQAGVLGPSTSPEQLDAATRAVLRHAGMTAFDLMHIMAQGEDAVLRAVDFGADFWANVEVLKASGRGVLICGCHLSNFNLAFLGFALKGFPVQVLSAAMPAAGFGLIAEMRNRGVLEETPISAAALRKAIARLRAGGACAIGVDWPVGAESGEPVPFFGRPAHLATGYIRMALSANAVILPLACRWSPARGYYTITQPPLTLEVTGDREADVLHNARRVLAVMENWIAETPDQWLMYHPVWPAKQSTADPEN